MFVIIYIIYVIKILNCILYFIFSYELAMPKLTRLDDECHLIEVLNDIYTVTLILIVICVIWMRAKNLLVYIVKCLYFVFKIFIVTIFFYYLYATQSFLLIFLHHRWSFKNDFCWMLFLYTLCYSLRDI